MTANSSEARAHCAGPGDTKERLLDAAERLFAELGFQGTSMRAVTQRAETAVSAANYHFGSKEELLGAVIRRRVQPINEKRLERLDAAESATPAPDVEAIVDVFLRPLFEAHAARLARDGGEYFRQVAARLYADPKHLVASLRRELFSELNERFADALQRALPDASPEAVGLGLQLTVGMMVHVISGQLTDGASEEAGAVDYELVLSRMIAYAGAGIRAAAAVPSVAADTVAHAVEGGGRR